MDPQGITQSIADNLASAWNAADGMAFAQNFTEDADFVDIRGTLHKSRQGIGHGHQAIFDTIYKGTTVQYTVVQAQEVAPGVLLAHVAGTMDPKPAFMPGNAALYSMVLTRDGDDWKIRAFHNTLVAEG